MKKVSEKDAAVFDTPYKIALIAMTDEEKDLHIALISSLMNKAEERMMFGEFIHGSSKAYMKQAPGLGFLIMSTKKEFWTGTMRYTGSVTEGEDYVHFNEMPLFRFNTYFGVSRVHYADLIDISERKVLDMPGVIANAVRVMLVKGRYAGDRNKRVLRPWAQQFLSITDNLLFIAYLDNNGVPKLVPIIQAQAASSSRIVLTKAPYREALADLTDGKRVAVYGMSLDMEAVLVKGFYHEVSGGIGFVEIDKVYNPLPPKAGYIYPEKKQEAVDFSQEPLCANAQTAER
ncbi:MAG: hypothetical protein IJQ88_08180 [Clostridia bacterium]|nr:hypothetical protein [Lachnospiraceae bacterium]MBQ6722126.1 hypothetical protein [Clostridia bacterium]